MQINLNQCNFAYIVGAFWEVMQHYQSGFWQKAAGTLKVGYIKEALFMLKLFTDVTKVEEETRGMEDILKTRKKMWRMEGTGVGFNVEVRCSTSSDRRNGLNKQIMKWIYGSQKVVGKCVLRAWD